MLKRIADLKVGEAAVADSRARGEDWPEYAHPRRPEFLLTLPHKHGTSGFFVARLHPQRT